ncbi:MAG: L-histidine N(alpha)-methyltransferase [Acidobacteriota bacterium]|jgi:L-histidine N-alpha-methyltransferase
MTGPSQTPRTSRRIAIDRYRDGREAHGFREELRASLSETPRRIPSRFFYDDEGSALFEEICVQPEYYPTRTERAILEEHAAHIVQVSGAEELVELGSGAATKTEILLDAMDAAGQLRLYVPFDVSEVMVERVAERLVARYPELRVHGVVGDFIAHLGSIPEGGRRLAVLLGGTIGNFVPREGREFLGRVGRRLSSGDHFLLGTDLIKDAATLEAAYNDARGVTAAFNLNILRVVNDLTGGDFDLDAFRHRAFWNAADHRIEMRLVSLRSQRVTLPELGLALDFDAGEEILTEISTKYDREKVETLLGGANLELVGWYTDPGERFALSLSRKG